MSVDQATLAAIRYGYGHRPGEPGEPGAEALLARLAGPDPLPPRRLGPDTAARMALLAEARRVRRAFRRQEIPESGMAPLRAALRARGQADLVAALARPLASPDGFRERLVAFWADHFTVSARNLTLGLLLPSLWRDAIRPHVTGSFAAMLVAVVEHPAMLSYLDQSASVGPNSAVGRRRARGLNENLARELLELHTLGTAGGYTQADVRELAELLTGLRVDAAGARFARRSVEPGAEIVLGERYGGRRPRLADIEAALHDIARRPETARHLAGKLARHFVASDPDPALVDAIERAYAASDGELTPAYAALLGHPAAWEMPLRKAKPPFDFVVSALRALGVRRRQLETLSPRELATGIRGPLAAMGQEPFRPPGPDGWPEAAEAWITPSGLAARIGWAGWAAQRFGPETDPGVFVATALRDAAPADLRSAVGRAETRWEGVALALASPAFNRR